MMEKILVFFLLVLMVTYVVALIFLIRDLHQMNVEERQNKREDK